MHNGRLLAGAANHSWGTPPVRAIFDVKEGIVKGDFSRWTFNPEKGYSGVLNQQGRIMLDSDWNAQGAIFRYDFRAVVRDLIGPHGGPNGDLGFKVKEPALADNNTRLTLKLGAGRYYVGGLPCRNVDEKREHSLAHHEMGDAVHFNGLYLVYLEAWERTVTFLEDDTIREVALGGSDTTLRTKVEWAVRIRRIDKAPGSYDDFLALVLGSQQYSSPTLMVRTREETSTDDESDNKAILDSGGYLGIEDRLYRVEVHAGGGPKEDSWGVATFKWSRANGSVALAIRKVEGTLVTVENPALDLAHSLDVGDWVEALNEQSVRGDGIGILARVDDIDLGHMKITLDRLINGCDGAEPFLLRRWDQEAGGLTEMGQELIDGAQKIKEGEWQDLEDGIEIQFQTGTTKPNWYRSGDYWFIPARTSAYTSTGKGYVEFPASAQSSDGVDRHYAPLCILKIAEVVETPIDLRCQFDPLAKPVT